MENVDGRFDAGQRAAIEAKDGCFLVLAPPGCGKTDILAERIARAREEGVEFDEMLCLTFTNRASRGMRSRIAERVADGEVGNLFVGNVHRYCSQYIFDNEVVPADTSIVDEDEQTDIFLSFDKPYFTNFSNRIDKGAVKTVADLASYIVQSRKGHGAEVKPAGRDFPALFALAAQCDFRSEAVPNDLTTRLSGAEARIDTKPLRYALRYIEYKRANLIIDFADILIIAYDHMLNEPEHRRYRWVQVDEVQDLNPLQMAIIDLLTGEEPTAMYLGDEQQAIFSFMGSKLTLLDQLKRRCKGRVMSLGNNYRAPAYLLNVCNDYAQKVLGVDADLLPRPVINTEREPNDLIVAGSPSADSELKRLLPMVRHYLTLDPSGRVAVLVSRNDEADQIADLLTANAIECFKVSGTDMFRTTPYKTLSSAMAVMVNDFNFLAWSRLLFGIGCFSARHEARTFLSELRRLKLTPADLIGERPQMRNFAERYMAEDEEMVVFDTETTGLNVAEDDIVQIAAFKTRGGRKVEGSDLNILMETSRPLPEIVGGKPNPLRQLYDSSEHTGRREGLMAFLDYVGRRPVVGHNVVYDHEILRHNVARELGQQIEFEQFNSLTMAKTVVPRLRKYKLEYLVERLGLEGQNSHLANDDIEATKSLVDYCVEQSQQMWAAQDEFLGRPATRKVAERLRMLLPLFKALGERLRQPVDAARRGVEHELRFTHDFLVRNNLMKPLGGKFDTFLRYVRNEWTPTPDEAQTMTLYDQITSHLHELTATINEGDLINSQELIAERVFIMTVYKGKGLEFENVIVFGSSNGNYPFFKVNKVLADKSSSIEAIDQAEAEKKESARKFYVALSRAKKRLCVTYADYDSFSHASGLTPFMQPILPHFKQGKAKR